MGIVELGAAAAERDHEAARLIHHTDPGVWHYLFDGERDAYDAFARGLWRLAGNSFSHSETVAVTGSDTMLALEMGYPGAAEPALRQAMNRAARDFLPERWARPLLERARDIDYLTPYLPPDCYYIHFLSVQPQARGRGLGRRLLHNSFERAREHGCRSVHLDVYCDNPAVDLYRGFGFRIVVRTAFPGKSGLPDHYRMVRDLSGAAA